LKNRYIVAAIQVETLEKQTKEDLTNQAIEAIERVCEECNVSAVCLNEWFNWDIPDQNTTRNEMESIAEDIPGPTTDNLSSVAKRHQIYLIAGTILEKIQSRFYDSSPVIGPDGQLLGIARLSRLPNTPIKHYVGAGISAGALENRTFDTDIGKIGVIVDWEALSHDVWCDVKNNAQVLFLPVNWSARATHLLWRIVSNETLGCYTVAANRAGWRRKVAGVGDMLYDGRSIIANPGGNIIACTSVATYSAWENVTLAMVDLNNTKLEGIK
jgi:N-carbamoylputrescine amidase